MSQENQATNIDDLLDKEEGNEGTEEGGATNAATEGANAPAAPATPAAPKVVLRLCKGQMPSPLVWFIKFHEPQDNRSTLAAKYFTTPGKISDIQTNANQKYIVANMVFTAEELEQARARIKENFVRGQADVAQGKVVSTRQLANTQPGDEAYALSVIDKIAAMDKSEGAVALAAARAAHNEANPRKAAGATGTVAATAPTEATPPTDGVEGEQVTHDPDAADTQALLDAEDDLLEQE